MQCEGWECYEINNPERKKNRKHFKKFQIFLSWQSVGFKSRRNSRLFGENLLTSRFISRSILTRQLTQSNDEPTLRNRPLVFPWQCPTTPKLYGQSWYRWVNPISPPSSTWRDKSLLSSYSGLTLPVLTSGLLRPKGCYILTQWGKRFLSRQINGGRDSLTIATVICKSTLLAYILGRGVICRAHCYRTASMWAIFCKKSGRHSTGHELVVFCK